MRRFLDWTAAQTGGGGQSPPSSSAATSNRRLSQQGKQIQTSTSSTTSGPHQQLLPSNHSTNPAKDLEIQHLTKLLHEIKYHQASSSPLPTAATSHNQREFVEKVQKTLPLFLNVFGSSLPIQNFEVITSPTTLSTSNSSSSIQRHYHSVAEHLEHHAHLETLPSTTKSSSTSPHHQQQYQFTPPQMEKFPDLLPFAFTVARLFVAEVRQRASNKHAEDASLAILQFLNVSSSSLSQSKSTSLKENALVERPDSLPTVKSSSLIQQSELPVQGWNLLLSLNALAYSQSSQIIQLLCDASLPSTLVKCLYLFFDLPISKLPAQPILNQSKEVETGVESTSESTSQQSINNDNFNSQRQQAVAISPLIKAFTQLLVQLCNHQSAIDELIRKDDLRLLIGIASSQCPPHNRHWRKTSFQALIAISKNMRENFMYLDENLCIQNYVENMNRISSLGLASCDEYIDMIKVLLDFLYNLDVNNRNQPSCIAPLIEQFKASRIIDLIEDLIVKIDETILYENQKSNANLLDIEKSSSQNLQQTPSNEEVEVNIEDYRQYGRRLMQSLSVMAKINVTMEALYNISNLKPLAMSRFEMLEQFKMPRPSARDCILNYEALRLFKMAWSKCADSYVIEAILDATISLFNDDKSNYFIFESQQLLVYYMTSYNFKLFPFKVKQKLFKFLEFIVIETNYIPCLELGTLGTIIKRKACSEMDLVLGLKTLIACLKFNSKFSEIFREIGLLEVIIELLLSVMHQDNLSKNATKLEVLNLLLEASQCLLAGPNNLNCTQFNESGAARYVFNCISNPKFFHIFIPTHSSSSDDGGITVTSRTGTPSSANQNQAHLSTINSHWSEILQYKPSIKQLQKVSFTIIRQLILSAAGDEHLANLLGLLARNLEDLKSFESSEKVKNLDIEFKDQVSIEKSSNPNFLFLLSQEVNLKIYILKSLMIILKDSHRCRILFRKAGGFTYIVSALDTLEKSLPLSEPLIEKLDIETHNKWKNINSRRIWRLIKNSMMTIVVAIRLEPANLRAFSEAIIINFTEALRKLGCYNAKVKKLPITSTLTNATQLTGKFDVYKKIFLAHSTCDFSNVTNDNMEATEACCQLFRFLYDMSLDLGDGTAELEAHIHQFGKLQQSFHQYYNGDLKSMSFDQDQTQTSENSRESVVFKKRSQLNIAPKRPPSLDLNYTNSEAAILTYPAIILTILDLIPSCPSEDLMIFICVVLKSLFKHERNQQLLCEVGMINKLLNVSWCISIEDKHHFLHDSVKYMLENLTRHSISVKELKAFLRLGNPLRCKNLDEMEITESSEETKQKLASTQTDKNSISSMVSNKMTKEKMPTDKIKLLVTMINDNPLGQQPPFIEFDMNSEGLTSIFMPSISPVNAKSLPPNTSSFLNSTLDVHTNEKNGVLGGVGIGERNFPPNTGLTFSSWICIEKFPPRSSDATHNLRLITIYRGSASTGKEYFCFRVQISALDRALTISTQETLLFESESKSAAQHDPDCNLRIWAPELLVEGRWHHIAITMTRSLVKQSSIHVYVDGSLVHQQRICYISSFVGSMTTGLLGNQSAQNTTCSAAAYVNAFIGPLPQLRSRMNARWKQGPCHLIEDTLNASFVGVIYTLSADFIGNFQNYQMLSEKAKIRNAQHLPNVSKYNRQLRSDSHTHKPLIHQQSAAIARTSYEQQSNQLTRVSSSGYGGQTSSVQQSSSIVSRETQSYNLAEERILISLDARATSLMTLSRMRRIYTRFDCRQVSRVLGLSFHENSTPILLLHNTGVHLNGPSRGVGAVTIGYNHVRCFVPSPTQHSLVSLGGCYILLGLVAQAQTVDSFSTAMKTFVTALRSSSQLQAQMDNLNGYQLISVFYWKKKHLLNVDILKLTFSLITGTPKVDAANDQIVVHAIQQVEALKDLICECFDLWLLTDMIDQVLEFIYDLISSSDIPDQMNSNLSSSIPNSTVRLKNLKCLRDMDLLPRMLRLLPQYDSQQVNSEPLETGIKSLLRNDNDKNFNVRTFDTKAVFLIKQTVFELLNKTPRQSDILYFGQFLASLLPSKSKERSTQTIKLRNMLLKSLLQMMTKNNQKEINHAMQEELVRILGFDWFMLFIHDVHLDGETISIGFLNLMIILSNDSLYSNFKSSCKTSMNGGWLKEPTFPTMDGKFNIQLLGVNVGVFFGLSSKRKVIRQEVLDAPNFFLLSSYLSNLSEISQIYLMIFQTMMGRLTKLDSQVLDEIDSFKELNLDLLCDCLVGDTHHKRRQTLSNIKFRCHELVVCLVYMLRDIMWKKGVARLKVQEDKETQSQVKAESLILSIEQYPVDVARFLMYLYNNNRDFQSYCRRNDKLVDALCACLMEPDEALDCSDSTSDRKSSKLMTKHPALKHILELSRLLILDTMSDPSMNLNETDDLEQLRIFERFLDSLSACREAQGELVDELMQQLLLMIDSTARHNSIKTIGGTENVIQFQLLLINSITTAEIVTEKIWSLELYNDNWNRVLTIIDHQLCLAEQIFKFNELLPKRNPPHAFIMQRVLNRILLFALSRPMQHMSDKLVMLELLKRIHDNRTIIILNHMHSPHSAEFFVCFIYCLMNIIEDNLSQTSQNALQSLDHQPVSLIERQYGHPSLCSIRADPNVGGPSSTSLLLVSMAKKVWDAIYQSKKGILSEALDVSLSLPAFTLETSLDLMQLKPEIYESCKRYWANFVETKQRSRQRKFQQQQADSTPVTSVTATSTAVNLLSGRLTRVVNAANFVSRVVGATAGTMASNVNMVGEKLGAQTNRPGRCKELGSRSSSEMSSSPGIQVPISVSHSGTAASTIPGSSIDQNDFFNSMGLSRVDIKIATQTHISFTEEYIKSQLSQKNHKLALHKYLCDEWLDTEQEVLLRERAIFGPDYGSKLDKWCLDLTEGPKRMRKKMVNNTRQFYEHYNYRPEQYNPDNKSFRYRPPMSYDSHSYYIKNLNINDHLFEFSKQLEQVFETTVIVDEIKASSIDLTHSSGLPVKSQVSSASSNKQQLDKTSSLLTSETAIQDHLHSSSESLTHSPRRSDSRLATTEANSPRPSEVDAEDGDSTSFVDFSPEIEAETNSAREIENTDSLSVLRLLEKNERISHMFRCSRVQGLDTYEGLLLFGREHFYLIDGFTLLKTREIKDIDSLPSDAHDPIIPNSMPNILAHSKKICAKFSFESIIEVHKRRYLLQPIALEVFSSDGRNTLIVFPRNIRNKVYSRLMAVSTQLTNNAHESLAGQKSNVSVEGGSGLLSNLIGETSVTQRWVRGELSNFQYLMNLNTIAGRSYNDLMQYPIFPWILADYTSDYLDLTKPSTFRDLSRPVGAQTRDRMDQFKGRFADWDDAETPPYHYGTFYSSAMIVASYMVRMEPFTQHFLRLQGGHFDLADRMFHSINDSWLSASKHNMADIKELIPEFFYLPEFLKNDNKYDLGIKQNGMKLDDVILPAWAKNDTREFIRLHRCALESDYVSAHLHEWIDLIFGYKQQGQAAIDAVNVFHHLFYEGNVDIYNTDIDPIKKNAVIGFINNFGQVPKQLFKRPHPARKVTQSTIASSNIPSPIQLGPILPSLSGGSATAIQRVLTRFPQSLKQTNVIYKDLRGPVGQIVQMDKSIVAVEQNKLLIPLEYCRYIAWGHADRSLRMGLYDSEKPIFVWEGCDHMSPSEILCCTIPNSRTMITAGTDSHITVWKIEKVRSINPVMSLYGHVEPITCLTSSQAYSIIVSGSRDKTVIIWDLNRYTFVRQLGGGPSEDLIHRGPISAIAINDLTGDIATCSSSWLYLWTINGELLAYIDSMNSFNIQQSMCHGTSSIAANLGNQLHILSVCFSQYNEWDENEVIITGASDGSVALWGLRYVQSLMKKHELEKAAKLKQQQQRGCIINQDEDDSQPDDNVNTYQDGERQESLSTQSEVPENLDKMRVVGQENETEDQLGPVFDEQEENITSPNRPSDPIEIRAGSRRRTSTLNSEWVKLSSSSTSTVDTNLRLVINAPPSLQINERAELQDNLSCSELNDSTEGGFPLTNVSDLDDNNKHAKIAHQDDVSVQIDEDTIRNELCSTPISDMAQDQEDRSSLLNVTESTCGDDLDGQSLSKANLLLTPNDSSLIKFSKSDTSLVDSFVIVGSGATKLSNSSSQASSSQTKAERARPLSSAGSHPMNASLQRRKRLSSSSDRTSNKEHYDAHRNKLLPNHCWRRELYLRALLHRNDGKTLPAAVTTLVISKDHKTLFVGDASGKIVGWSTV